jgi:hypothetical protein
MSQQTIKQQARRRAREMGEKRAKSGSSESGDRDEFCVLYWLRSWTARAPGGRWSRLVPQEALDGPHP